MSIAESVTTSEPEEKATLDRLDAAMRKALVWLEAAVDRVNPIMVKETRQALKSRQFILTFFLVLVACWISSFAVVAIIGPEVYYVAEGPRMLTVYFAILAFPLMLIVPYTAFRSLAVEQEDNTYELLSISALTTGQIVTGKLGSAVVQMLVYLSAVSPCIAFTFLLRGVDALTVALLLFYFILGSLGLSMIALLAGTMARARYSQVILSVILVLCFAMAFFFSVTMAWGFIQQSYQFIQHSDFWIKNLAFLTIYVTTFALIRAASAAQIAFNSENRSSPMRWIMLIQQASFLGWFIVMTYAPTFAAILGVLVDRVILAVSISCAYWYIMGSILTSEWPYLSRRVQRDLPQSQLGIMFLTWLNPGSGTGFMFSVANFSFVTILGATVMSYLSAFYGLPAGDFRTTCLFLFICWSYFVTFLGTGRLLIGQLRRFIYVSLTAGVLIHLILMLLAVGLPHLLDYMSHPQQIGVNYSLLHISNPVWTMEQVLHSRLSVDNVTILCITMASAAIVVLLLNIRTTWGEVQHQRRALPTRVAEEESLLHPEPVPKPQNPWEN